MLFWEKQTKRSAVEKEVKKIIKGIMKSYEKEEMGEAEEAFFEQIDSLRIIELIVLTEKKFKIEIPTEQLAQLNDQKLDTFIDLILQTMKGDVNDGSETNHITRFCWNFESTEIIGVNGIMRSNVGYINLIEVVHRIVSDNNFAGEKLCLNLR